MSESISPRLSITTPGALELTGDAIQARLKLVFPPSIFDHQVMPARVTAQGWTKLLRRTPFVGVGWGKLDAVRSSPARSFVGVADWSVFLVTKNIAGGRARYWGDAQGVGLFAMIRAATVVLQGYSILGVGLIQMASIGNAYAEGWDDEETAMAMLELRVGTTLSLPSEIAGVAEDDFLRLGETWTFGAEGTPAAPEQGSLAPGVLNVRGG